MDNFVLIHRRSEVPFTLDSPNWAVWKTCLRQIALGFEKPSKTALRAEDEICSGAEAYAFCLEVICGLHSPLVAETEVLGQFRKHFEAYLFPATPFGLHLRKTVQWLLQDAKQVRQNFLKGMGSQSYGSLCRRYVEGKSEIGILGAGVLARSLLPWIKNASVSVFCRNLENRRAVLSVEFDGAKLTHWDDKRVSPEAILIAAPLSSVDFSRWLEGRRAPGVIVDWREDSDQDRIQSKSMIVTLKECFSNLEITKNAAQDRARLAKDFIADLAAQKMNVLQIRPYGWEDVCV